MLNLHKIRPLQTFANCLWLVILVSEQIRYDQSRAVAIAAKPIGAHPKTIPKTITSGRFVQGAATAKPIGAHPTSGCPFAMYQILSVTHLYVGLG